ncbi:MAG: methyltransferase domain-containing protein, partial [Syntrophales bacterium]
MDDFVYCRFVLHHLNQPTQVIKKIFHVLKPNGIYAAEEGIVNFAFSYPVVKAWG